MGKTTFAELDEITFNRIKKTKNACGMIDEKKFFSKMKEGDSIVFSCRGKKIEAYLKNIKIVDSISDYLKSNNNIGVLEINNRNPVKLLSLMNDVENRDGKKVRVYEVDYHPYGEDDEENENNDDIDENKKISKIFEALIAGSMNNGNIFRDDDDEF